MRVLILDDDLNDLRIASDAARAMGIADVELFQWLAPAQSRLREGLRGEAPLPDAIILDLALGCESGYELLRLWHSNRAQAKVHMIVWSHLEERNQQLCELFNIDSYVSKWDGVGALSDALRLVNVAAQNGRPTLQ